MSRLFTALVAATMISAAAPAAAFSLQLGFPTLTYPSQPAADVSQTCQQVTTLSGTACSSSK